MVELMWVSSRDPEEISGREIGPAGVASPAGQPESFRHPPFLVFKKRLYVLAKEAPRLDHKQASIDEIFKDEPKPRPHLAIAQKGRPAGIAPRQAVPVRRQPVRRVAFIRRRPYVKGPFRVYSSRPPHLAPAGHRHFVRKRVLATFE